MKAVKRVGTIVVSILLWVIILVAALYAFTTMATRDEQNVSSLLGYTPMVVQSDSMAPTFEKGDLIFIHKCDTSKLKEGEMTKVRATVVCEDSLYKIADKHNFSDFLYVGKSERMHQGNRKIAIMADSVEAVIAAIYFDSGLEETEKFIIDNLKEEIEIATKNVGIKDHKTVLQEKLQVNGNVNIKYEIINETGPDHDKTFTAEVKLDGKVLAVGKGKTKKQAEMDAAGKALETL